MYKLFLILIPIFFMTGCTGFTQLGVVKELSAERSQRYSEYVEAQSLMISEVAKLITEAQRGGVKIDVDDEGKIKSFEYTERLDIDKLVAAANVQKYQEEKVASTIEELGNFVSKATNIGTVIAREAYNSKNTKEIQRANVAINESNNVANMSMWNGLTNSMSTAVTGANNTAITSVSGSSSSSSDIANALVSINESNNNANVSMVEDYTTNFDHTTNTSVTTDSSNNSTTTDTANTTDSSNNVTN